MSKWFSRNEYYDSDQKGIIHSGMLRVLETWIWISYCRFTSRKDLKEYFLIMNTSCDETGRWYYSLIAVFNHRMRSCTIVNCVYMYTILTIFLMFNVVRFRIKVFAFRGEYPSGLICKRHWKRQFTIGTWKSMLHIFLPVYEFQVGV